MTQMDEKPDKKSKYAYGHCRFIVFQNNAEKTYVAGKKGNIVKRYHDTHLEIAELPAGDYLVFAELDHAWH